MPKLPVVKPKQLVRALIKLDFFKHRQRGTSHLIMADKSGRRSTIAVHYGKDIPTGTLKAILRDLDISVETFVNALKK